MTPKIFSTGTREPAAVKHFEIRLDESILLLRGGRDESASTLLKGSLVLCLSESLRAQNLRLRYTGERRISWNYPGGGSPDSKKREEFFRKTWDFVKVPEVLDAGNYDWPFELVVPGDTIESLEGLSGNWVIYRLKATIERGFLHQNCVVRRQVRIIRTLDPAALELAHAMAVENEWPNKIEYAISTPSKAVIFGSTIRVDFKIVPLLKGLTIGRISIQLSQKQALCKTSPRNIVRRHNSTQIVAAEAFHLPDDLEVEEINGREGFAFHHSIQIPKSLCKCVQSFEGLGIKVKHHLSFNVQLHNPDGHVSELHANLPLHIFLSPHLSLDDQHNLVDGQDTGIAIAASELIDLTPPQYGEHVLDMLYDGIDTSGYMTPADTRSGITTPVGALRSRSVSADNMATLSREGAMSSPSLREPSALLQRRLGGTSRGAQMARSSRQSLLTPVSFDGTLGSNISPRSITPLGPNPRNSASLRRASFYLPSSPRVTSHHSRFSTSRPSTPSQLSREASDEHDRSSAPDTILESQERDDNSSSILETSRGQIDALAQPSSNETLASPIAESPTHYVEDNNPELDRTSDQGIHELGTNATTASLDEDGDQGNNENDHVHIQNLSRVPSYTTALRSSHRIPLSQALPTYQAATRNSSPVHSGTSTPTITA